MFYSFWPRHGPKLNELMSIVYMMFAAKECMDLGAGEAFNLYKQYLQVSFVVTINDQMICVVLCTCLAYMLRCTTNFYYAACYVVNGMAIRTSPGGFHMDSEMPFSSPLSYWITCRFPRCHHRLDSPRPCRMYCFRMLSLWNPPGYECRELDYRQARHG